MNVLCIVGRCRHARGRPPYSTRGNFLKIRCIWYIKSSLRRVKLSLRFPSPNCSVSQFCQISRLSHSVQIGALEISSKIVGAVAQLAPMLSLSSHNFQRPLLSCVNIFSLHRLPSTLSALSFNSFFATLCNRTSNLAVLRVNSR